MENYVHPRPFFLLLRSVNLKKCSVANENNRNFQMFADLLVDYVKNDFSENKPTSIPSIPIEEFAKSRNREGLKNTSIALHDDTSKLKILH
jgi:hypothetical protein